MTAQIHEIGDGIFRLSVFVPEVAPPAGFTFNHFLIRAEQPMLFHCGKRKMFPLLAEAVANRHLVARAEGGKVRVRSAGGGESLAKSGKLLLQRCGKRGALEALLVEHAAEASEALALP